MTSGVYITYGDIAVGAREQFVPETTDKEDFVNLSQLKEDLIFPNYTNPCELYNVVLDGGSLPIPSTPESAVLGWWSEQVCNESAEFETPIVLVLSAEKYFYSQGISLYFDTINDVYANRIKMRWYRDDELISEKDFMPNSSRYFCKNAVEFYNRIEITFYSMNIPNNRLRLHSVVYGCGAKFTRNQLNSVKLIQEIDALSTQIPINTCDFEVRSTDEMAYSFSEGQPIKVYFNGDLKAKSFVKRFDRKNKTQWQVKTEDYIGIMQGVSFSGGVYEEANAVDLLEQIFDAAKVPFTIEDVFRSETVSGYIPYTSCREALMQVAFAIGAVVDTSGREDVYIYKFLEETKQTIPLDRIMQGQKNQSDTRMTAFELTSHEYIKTDENIVLYEAEKSGSGENIFIKFSQPVYSLSITDGAIISERNANYAVINAGESCVLSGKKYDHIETIVTKKNPLILATDTENIIAIEKATLVSKNNVDRIAEKCYNYFVKTTKFTSKIVEGKHNRAKNNIKYGRKKYGEFGYGEFKKMETFYDEPVQIGDYIGLNTQYLGTIYGRVVKQSYNLNGGIIIKDTVVR